MAFSPDLGNSTGNASHDNPPCTPRHPRHDTVFSLGRLAEVLDLPKVRLHKAGTSIRGSHRFDGHRRSLGLSLSVLVFATVRPDARTTTWWNYIPRIPLSSPRPAHTTCHVRPSSSHSKLGWSTPSLPCTLRYASRGQARLTAWTVS